MVLENSRYPLDPRVRKEAESLTSAGFAVEVLAPRERGRPNRECIRGVNVTRFPLREGHGVLRDTALEFLIAFFAVSPLVIVRILRSREGTLHVHNPPDIFFPLLWLARARGWSTVFDNHDDAEGMLRDKLGRTTKLSAVMAWLRTRSARAADLTITTNESQRSLVVEDARRVLIVRNAPPPWFADHKAHPRTGRARLVFLGEIGTQDRVDQSVEVLASLIRDHDIDVELLIIGDGPERPQVERCVSQLKLQDRVIMTGTVPYEDVPELLTTAHIGLDTAAISETNHGTTMVKVIEYLAVGLPVVTNALRETQVTGGDAIVTTTADSVAAFTEALLPLLTSADTWQARAEMARSRGVQLQWPAQVEGLIATYRELASGPDTRDNEPSGKLSGVNTGLRDA